MKSHLIKIFHSFDQGKKHFATFLDNIAKTLARQRFVMGLNYNKGEFFYSFSSSPRTYTSFESQFYTYFNNFQIINDDKKIRDYDKTKSAIGEMKLMHQWFFPFKIDKGEESEFMFNIFRTFENFDVANDKVGFFVEMKPIINESFGFYVRSKFEHRLFRQKMFFQFYKYMFKHQTQKNRKSEGHKYFEDKLKTNLFEVKLYFIVQSQTKAMAQAKIRSLANNFLTFKNYPLNQFNLKIRDISLLPKVKEFNGPFQKNFMNADEISSFFHFPKNPKNETALLTVKSKKLAIPIGIPTFEYTVNEKNEVMPKNFPDNINIVGISDYRSINVPIGIYDEDRLKHVYVVGKTGTGKTKFLVSLMINDVQQGRGIGVIDPHGDLIDEVMMHIPADRKDDVIIFDPTDEQYPFCLNPLDVEEHESKQILAKGFIDIFKKFFGANWNPKLEHVLRMIFLALLDKPNSTLFDIIRALTDKDFRYEMIDAVTDDVVRNFRTNEFAGWSQQFNTEAIMPILNKVGQLLSIDILKNIFASPENKLDFRRAMDERKILLIKLPKGKLQEDIMGFLGAMFVTKLFQAAIGRQSVAKDQRTPFYLYVDEFQNFATDTFNEILSEARKYGLSLAVAHQYIKQIPENISDSLFGNVGTLISFRISPEDSEYMKNQFSPFLEGYDLSNLSMREFYCKMQVQGQVKDPFSIRSCYIPDVAINKDFVAELYRISRTKYARSLAETKKVIEEKQADVLKKIEEFNEPII